MFLYEIAVRHFIYNFDQDVMLPFSLDTMNMMAMTDNICITNDYVGISSECKIQFLSLKLKKKLKYAWAYADSGADCNQFTNLGTDSRYCGLALSTNNMAMVGMDIPICGE